MAYPPVLDLGAGLVSPGGVPLAASLGDARMSLDRPDYPPGGAPGGMGPFWRGDRLVDPRVDDLDRALSAGMHLWWIAFLLGIGPFALLIPVVVWAIRQSSSGFTDDHGREAINAQITLVILVIVPIFWPFLPFWIIASLINSIRAAAASGRREHFRYPVVFRLLK